MRKIAAVFLMLALITAVFVSCDKDKGDETTTPILTGATISSTQPTANPVSTTTQNANPTYILTTSPDKTVPWGETTRYDATTALTTQPSTIIINIPSDFNTDPVSPSYSQAPTTVPTTPKPTTTTTTKPTTTKPTTTKPVVKKPVSVDTGGAKSFDGDSTLMFDVDGSSWSSDFVSNTMYLPAYIDGNNTGKNVKCTLNGTPDSAGNYTITIDVSSLSLSSGAVLNISFPEGFIQTKAGTQYSKAFEISADY